MILFYDDIVDTLTPNWPHGDEVWESFWDEFVWLVDVHGRRGLAHEPARWVLWRLRNLEKALIRMTKDSTMVFGFENGRWRYVGPKSN